MTDAYGSYYHAMPGGLPARLRIEGIGAAAEQSRFLARMARPAVTDMTSCALAPSASRSPLLGPRWRRSSQICGRCRGRAALPGRCSGGRPLS